MIEIQIPRIEESVISQIEQSLGNTKNGLIVVCDSSRNWSEYMTRVVISQFQVIHLSEDLQDKIVLVNEDERELFTRTKFVNFHDAESASLVLVGNLRDKEIIGAALTLAQKTHVLGYAFPHTANDFIARGEIFGYPKDAFEAVNLLVIRQTD